MSQISVCLKYSEDKTFNCSLDENQVSALEPLCTLVYLNKQSATEPGKDKHFEFTIAKQDKWIVRTLRLLHRTYFNSSTCQSDFCNALVFALLKRFDKKSFAQYHYYYNYSALPWLLREISSVNRALQGFWGVESFRLEVQFTDLGANYLTANHVCLSFKIRVVSLHHHREILKHDFGGFQFAVLQHCFRLELPATPTKDNLVAFLQTFYRTKCQSSKSLERPKSHYLMGCFSALSLSEKELQSLEQSSVWTVLFQLLHGLVARLWSIKLITIGFDGITHFLTRFFEEEADKATTLEDKEVLLNNLLLFSHLNYVTFTPTHRKLGLAFHVALCRALYEQILWKLGTNPDYPVDLALFLQHNARNIGQRCGECVGVDAMARFIIPPFAKEIPLQDTVQIFQ